MKKINLLLILCLPFSLYAQTKFNSTAYASVQLPSDARTTALANGGTALDCDLSAINTNPARLSLLNVQHSVAFDYFNMPSISKDAKKVAIKYAFVNGERSTFGVGINYYSTGAITLRDEFGADISTIKSAEYSVSLSYATQISNNSHLGATFRFLNQNKLVDTDGNATRNGNAAIGIDVGFIHNFELDEDYKKIRLGIALQNLGTKLGGTLYQPMNLSLSTIYSNGYYDNDEKFSHDFAFLIGLQVDKPLVPSLPVIDSLGKILKGKDFNRGIINCIFSTWNDAPGGAWENMKQLRYSLFSEVVLQRNLSLRGGFAYEDAAYGSRTFFSLGAGIKWNYQESDYQINLAYLVPQGANAGVSPLKNTISLQFAFQFGRKS